MLEKGSYIQHSVNVLFMTTSVILSGPVENCDNMVFGIISGCRCAATQRIHIKCHDSEFH